MYVICQTYDEQPKYLKVDTKKEIYYIYYDPNAASQYKTRKEAKQIIKKYIDDYGNDAYKIVSFDKAENNFDKWLINGCCVGKANTINQKISRLYNNESPEEILKWRFEYHEIPGCHKISHECYKSWPDLYIVFTYLFSVQSYSDFEYKNATSTVQVRINRDATDFDLFKEEIKLALPYITHKDEDGNKIIDVFDHKLSEYGDTVYIHVKKNNKFDIRGRYSSEDKDNLTWRQLFDYLKQYRYYE